MKKLIFTSAFILGSIVSVFAQAGKPGSPIGGIVVKGGFTSQEVVMPGSPIGGIVVKGGHNGLAIEVNPLYNPSGTSVENPMYESEMKIDGNPIGGIIVKEGHNGLALVGNNPLYQGSGSTGVNPLRR